MDDLWHFAALPFAALCGDDEPGRQTTMIVANVTCPHCLRRRLADAEAVIKAARRAVGGEGVISLPKWYGVAELVRVLRACVVGDRTDCRVVRWDRR